ncbi:sulfatase-like hydrolase/transferase [Salegentibacter maritimus]|uniref:Sulfatase-like hydrolase/transferase n=1 Tax=Salegentibacter maritimus TaxID=2794347 RepID=A0ABS0TIC4_9FLAO|nr:sulfatase-like hydrolase/transferase [Salegentibacter maritimus]MBI6120814.1 sulfatase-like hydrolase/transferase [Salegentibacter maritimus]
MIKFKNLFFILILFSACKDKAENQEPNQVHPNIVLIYADDLGYGDLSAYGGEISTPNIDKLAENGLKHTNAYATSSICTPSRFSMLTGEYSWRQIGSGVAAGNDGALIKPGTTTLQGVLQNAGYSTAIVGKWHLGLGNENGPDWNGKITPGPLEVGFDYAFMIPATGDRVPTVFVENHQIVNLDPEDPIKVSYKEKLGDNPTGKENPELLKMDYSHGHNQSIVNGISRIGYQTGGESALWKDEDFADIFVEKSAEFMEDNSSSPFFLFFSAHDIHVPRAPHQRFVGKSGKGLRGDAILQLDWTVGAIVKKLEDLGVRENTLIIVSSDNGPVTDDGYKDMSDEFLGNHKPAGNLSGGKYSVLEAGTKIPLIVNWPGVVRPNTVSEALISQVDFLRSFASLTGIEVAIKNAPDSFDLHKALLGEHLRGRESLVQMGTSNGFSFIKNNYKYIVPNNASPEITWGPDVKTGFSQEDQLFNLKIDPTESNNIAKQKPDILDSLKKEYKRIRDSGSSYLNN